MVDTYTIDDIQVQNNIIIDMNNRRVEFQLLRCKVIDIDESCIKVNTRSIDTLYPLMFAFEKKHGLKSSFSLEECGVCLNITTDTTRFKDILNDTGVYIIDLRLDVIKDLRATYRILRITADSEGADSEGADPEGADSEGASAIAIDTECALDIGIDTEDVAEPDSIDIEEIKENITRKIKKLKKKYLEIAKRPINDLSLTDLISLEDNLYEFFQNNI